MATGINTNLFDKIQSGGGAKFSEITAPVVPPQEVQTAPAVPATSVDSVEITKAEGKPKKGLVTRFKDFIRTIKKFNATLGGYTKATFVGAKDAVIAGSTLYAGFKVIDFFKTKAAQKAGKEAIKSMKKLPVVAGVIGAIAAIGISFWKASLDVNKDRAEIDHSWTKTPIDNN